MKPKIKPAKDLSEDIASFRNSSGTRKHINGAHRTNSAVSITNGSANGHVTSKDLHPEAEELNKLLSFVKDVLVKYVNDNHDDEVPVSLEVPATELRDHMDFSISDLKGVGVDGIMSSIKDMLKYSTRTGSPRFLDKLYAATNPIGMISELLIAALNCNGHVYQVSPVGTLMELECISKMSNIIGYNSGGGVFCPGGSASNTLAMVTARNYMFPEIKTMGIQSFPKKLVLFTSAHAHYSIEKAAMSMGLGTDNVIHVDTSADGRLIVEDLEQKIKDSLMQGFQPFFVNATAGTTVMCSFDPLRDIARVTKKYKLWLHVDGSWGGSVVLSQKWKPLVDGLEESDSFTVNPHKLLGVPLQCSILLTRSADVIPASNSLSAGYLFHGNSFDLGDGTLGCGRRSDGIKFFLSWKYYGTGYYRERVDKAFSNAKILCGLVKQNERLELLWDFEQNEQDGRLNVCFWYIPKSLESKYNVDRSKIKQQLSTNESLRTEMSQVTKSIHAALLKRGKLMLDYAPMSHPFEYPLFFRVPINSPHVSSDHLNLIVDEITTIGDDLFAI
ncbi:pyridoxal phosphate-dependent transferase [Paraphysoderma sedebokerense]|nr:pyridoxal phosphate-dependent transferase [Paraphysoderma sedebokerense]